MFLYSFLFFSTITLISSFSVFLSKNPVESVLFLIFCFFNTGVILFFFNLEIFSIFFIIIYVGAIAILFLFIVMMLNIKLKYKYNILNNSLIFLGFFIFLYITLNFLFFKFFKMDYLILNEILRNINGNITNIFTDGNLQNYMISLESEECSSIEIIGQVLFNNFYIYLPIIGFLLLIPLIGVIVLTLPFNKVKKMQLDIKQLSRRDSFLSFFKKTQY
jgi:NADH:ubiquinone oxidoreductase subunit 6 (subunit J)